MAPQHLATKLCVTKRIFQRNRERCCVLPPIPVLGYAQAGQPDVSRGTRRTRTRWNLVTSVTQVDRGCNDVPLYIRLCWLKNIYIYTRQQKEYRWRAQLILTATMQQPSCVILWKGEITRTGSDSLVIRRSSSAFLPHTYTCFIENLRRNRAIVSHKRLYLRI